MTLAVDRDVQHQFKQTNNNCAKNGESNYVKKNIVCVFFVLFGVFYMPPYQKGYKTVRIEISCCKHPVLFFHHPLVAAGLQSITIKFYNLGFRRHVFL